MPLTPIQALFVDMGTDSLTAVGPGVEQPDRRACAYRRDCRLLHLPLALRAYLSTTRKQGRHLLDALTQLAAHNPWLPQATSP